MKRRAEPCRALKRESRVWIFGAGLFGRAVCRALQSQGFDVAGFVETQPKATNVLGLPVQAWADLPASSRGEQLAVGIYNHFLPLDGMHALASSHGFEAPFLAHELYDQFADALGWRYWLSRREFLLANVERAAAVAERLADEESRATFARTLAFRLGQDLPFSSRLSEEPRYFNSYTLARFAEKPIAYVDCGAYDGDTFADLLALPRVKCSRAWLLEPDPANFAKLAARVAGEKVPAVCLPLAAADRYRMLSFTADEGEASRVGDGSVSVAAVALDELLPNESIGMLKLDVEGGEAMALRGARRLIERSRPVLAVSLYHNPQDLWELPELLFEMCPGYDFHVGQHQANTFDSVLYAVPKP
ncbi:FkbM family methyltransferase [Ramlibacter albus]|uniref:FkbM family methyltransferase n=1 Tax=Ramlibacter albus TaxID=2079448 RepID=A0A923M663_9BURK|nr:FkbM family methyltransferase [Ramlibacter albus]MBC5763633.1 FkbM family methyltransferase [Ramlibacter albus]